ncbi:hypothetical protein MYX65_10740, partial [Acidobacteria bacterium AH-259-L09]|nr:hypothetical protein [Acidobacteria bacterium AH-259-L09]
DRYNNMLTKNGPSTNFQTFSFSGDQGKNQVESYSINGVTQATYSYDAAGQMISETGRSYNFNGASRLTKVTETTDGDRGTYRYDALGRRVKKSWDYVAGNRFWGSLKYIYGGQGELLGEVKDENENNGSFEDTDIYYILMEGQLIAKRVTGSNQSGNVNRIDWVHRNHLGEVKVVDQLNLNNSGCMNPAFWQGICATTTISSTSEPFAAPGSDQFQGHKLDDQTGLQYMGARFYHPTISRWMSPDRATYFDSVDDPLSLNRYSFVRNDPVNLVDPDGRRHRPAFRLGNCRGEVKFDPSEGTVRFTGREICQLIPVRNPRPQPREEIPRFNFRERFQNCLDQYGDDLAKRNLTLSKFLLAASVAVEEGVDAIDVLAIWATESSYSTDVNLRGVDNDRGPMQLTPIAIDELDRWGLWDPPLDYEHDLRDNLKTGARYFKGILDNYLDLFNIPRDQAYAVYNGGPGGYEGSEAQNHLQRFNENREVIQNIRDCFRFP